MPVTAPRAMSAHNNLNAVLFQNSAEYVALCLQAYQLARHAVTHRLESGTYRNPAVVFDLDETVLDNAAYQAWQIKNGANYHDDSWNRWCNAKQAEAVPGSIEFIRFIEQAGITPLFITSRLNQPTRAATLINLAALGVITPTDLAREQALVGDPDPYALPKNTRLFMKGMDPVKTPSPSGGADWPMKNKFDHRVWVTNWRGFEIILSVGDNLSDYAEYYGRVYDPSVPENQFYSAKGEKLTGKHPTVAERRSAVLQDAGLFGRDFILIPNPTYGGWLRAYEDNKLGAADEQYSVAGPVREALVEPQTDFVYANPKAGQPGQPDELSKSVSGPKLASTKTLRIWDGV